MQRFFTPFLLLIPLSVSATELVIPSALLTGECNPCEIKSPGRESFTISYKIKETDNWGDYIVDLRLDDAEFDDLSISSHILSGRDYFPFYALKFLDDHRLQVYGVSASEGARTRYYHYFVRGKDKFHYLGNFGDLSYDEEWDVFIPPKEAEFYQLDENKLVSETQNAQIESLSDGNCNPCEIKPAGQESFTFSYTIDNTRDGEGYPLVIELNNVKFDNLKMYQLGHLATHEFYQIKFFDDHRFQIYGFPTGEGGGTRIIIREYHLFIRDGDTFHYLGRNFDPFLYHKKLGLFAFNQVYYRLIDNKLRKVAR